VELRRDVGFLRAVCAGNSRTPIPENVLRNALKHLPVGTLNAVAVVSAACALIGLLCVSLPNMIDNAQRGQANASPSASPVVAAIDEEANQAVDYFGALRLVGAAFYFGLGAARKLKRRGPHF
jgi:hypothetical protein